MVKYTIENYDDYLMMEVGMYPYQTPLWKTNRLDESKGIVDDYLPIIDELYNALIHTERIPFNDEGGYFAYLLSDYKLQNQDVFLGSVKITVLSGILGDNNFYGNDVFFSRDGEKMMNARFVIRIKDKYLETENGKNEFYESMAHELQHAYRFHCIFLSSDNYKDEEMEKMHRYAVGINKLKNATRTVDIDTYQAYYLSDRNEISSEANRLYEFLRQHEDIGEWNFQDHLEEMPLYVTMVSLRAFYKNVDEAKRNREMAEYLGNILNSIERNQGRSPSVGYTKLRGRILSGLLFSKRLLYRTLIKAFDDFGRRQQNPRPNRINDLLKEKIENEKEFDLLREIFNKH